MERLLPYFQEMPPRIQQGVVAENPDGSLGINHQTNVYLAQQNVTLTRRVEEDATTIANLTKRVSALCRQKVKDAKMIAALSKQKEEDAKMIRDLTKKMEELVKN